MMGSKGLKQTDKSPIYFCPVCYRKLYKCIKFNHIKRYESLISVCDEFKGQFISSQPYERDKLSAKQWFQKRLKALGKAYDCDYLPPKNNLML